VKKKTKDARCSSSCPPHRSLGNAVQQNRHRRRFRQVRPRQHRGTKNSSSDCLGRRGDGANIAIRICLGLCPCTLELGKVCAPAWVGPSEPLLEYRAGVNMSMLTMDLLLNESEHYPPHNKDGIEGKWYFAVGLGEPGTGTNKDAPVELQDASVYFGFREDAAERCVM